MRFKNERVRIDAVEITDTHYRITTAVDIDDVVDSIRTIGLLHPPLLLKLKSTYRIVSGFRRISALLSLGVPDFDARLLTDNNDHLEISKIAITENALQRPLNIVEKARSLKLLSLHINDFDKIIRLAAPLGVPCDQKSLKKYLKISVASPSIQEGLIQGYVALPVALILSDFDDPTMNLFLDVFKTLRLSLNRQRAFLALITEISHRDDIEPAQLMNQDFVTEILTSDKLDRSIKTKQLLRQFKHIRYPEITKAEEAFEKYARNLKMGKGMKLIAPTQFEGTDYRMQLTFKNVKEINSLTNHLDRILKDPDFKKAIER